MREWAFATSPHGLGLPDGGWLFTPREFRALADMHTQQVISRSDFYNAHFRASDTVGWMASDFLREGGREERMQEKRRSDLAAQRANTALVMNIKPGAPPTEDVPLWAVGPYRG